MEDGYLDGMHEVNHVNLIRIITIITSYHVDVDV
jgi:hypothetical protein